MSDWTNEGQTSSGDFSPSKLAHALRSMLSPKAEPEERETARSLWLYHTEYLRVTAHGDGNRPSPMPVAGGTVYFSWQAVTEALYYSLVYGMALNYWDEDEYERQTARQAWKEADWDAMWKECRRDAKAGQAVAV